MIALDASALLAFLFREAGHTIVGAALPQSCLSTISLSEVLARFVRDGHDPREALALITDSPIEVVPFLTEDAALTAALLPSTRPDALSLGDRACLALGMARGMPVYTADRVWASLGLEVSIEVIR